MTEDWFEDELPWLGPPPQLPPKREQPQQRTPSPRSTPTVEPRRAVAAHAAAVNPAFPQARVPTWAHELTVPPSVRAPKRRYGEVVALRWIGILLVLVATLTALALIMRDVRSSPESTPAPTAQMVIPAASGSDGGVPVPAIAPNPLFAGKVICLDAAHGGSDRGFQRTGDANAPAMDEALYTVAYARDLAERLTAMGFTVALTRDSDTVRNALYQDVNRDGLTRENGATEAEAMHNAQIDELQARVAYCNDEQADLLISIHFDGSNDPNDSGFSTWYADGRPGGAESQRLAQLINEQLATGLAAAGFSVPDRGIMLESTAALRGDQMLYDSLYVITGSRQGLREPSQMPGVVTEVLTLSNATDAQLLVNEAGRAAIVTAMADAIGRYFTEQPAG